MLEEFGHGVGEDVAECMVEHFGARCWIELSNNQTNILVLIGRQTTVRELTNSKVRIIGTLYCYNFKNLYLKIWILC